MTEHSPDVLQILAGIFPTAIQVVHDDHPDTTEDYLIDYEIKTGLSIPLAEIRPWLRKLGFNIFTIKVIEDNKLQLRLSYL